MKFRAEVAFELNVPDHPTGPMAADREHFPGIFEFGRLAGVLGDLQEKYPDLIVGWKLLRKPGRVG